MPVASGTAIARTVRIGQFGSLYLIADFDYSHSYNASWQWREVHGGSQEGVRTRVEDASRKLFTVSTSILSEKPILIYAGIVQDRCSRNALG